MDCGKNHLLAKVANLATHGRALLLEVEGQPAGAAWPRMSRTLPLGDQLRNLVVDIHQEPCVYTASVHARACCPRGDLDLDAGLLEFARVDSITVKPHAKTAGDL